MVFGLQELQMSHLFEKQHGTVLNYSLKLSVDLARCLHNQIPVLLNPVMPDLIFLREENPIFMKPSLIPTPNPN